LVRAAVLPPGTATGSERAEARAPGTEPAATGTTRAAAPSPARHSTVASAAERLASGPEWRPPGPRGKSPAAHPPALPAPAAARTVVASVVARHRSPSFFPNPRVALVAPASKRRSG